MRRDEALGLLAAYRSELHAMGVQSLSLFGSTARDEAGPDSDVDVLVVFSRPVGLFAFIRLQMRPEEILRRPVDLTTPDALKRQLRDRILSEAVHAA